MLERAARRAAARYALLVAGLGGAVEFASWPTARGAPVARGLAAPVSSSAYDSLVQRVEAVRRSLAREYTIQGSPEVLQRAREYALSAVLDQLLPRWNGTRWSFNGTAKRPGEGSIACGVFVSTILGEAGFRVQRLALARQPSEFIIETLVQRSRIKRFSNVPVERFVEQVRASGPGLYLVGLDCHVGFLVNRGDGLLFVHSSYVYPWTVICEDASHSRPLVVSKYRVVGKLLDDAMMRKWLDGSTFETKLFRRGSAS